MRKSSILLIICFSLFPLSSNNNTINSKSRDERQIIKIQSAIQEEIDLKNYLKTLRVGNPKDSLTMLDIFNEDSRYIVNTKCRELKIKPKHFYRLVHFESRGNTKARNKFSRATGIIQITPATAKMLGISVDELYNMTLNDQLYYAFEYLKHQYKCKPFDGTYEDLYLSVLHPVSRLKKGNIRIADTTTKTGRNIIKWNPVFDLNKDSIITVSEVKQFTINSSKSM